MPLVIIEHYYHFVVKILKSQQGTKIILAVQPPVGEWNWSHDMEVIEVFVRIRALSSRIQQDHILTSQVKERLEGIRILVRSLRFTVILFSIVNG